MKLAARLAACLGALVLHLAPAAAQQTVPMPVGAFCLNTAGTAWIPMGGAAGNCLSSGGGGGTVAQGTAAAAAGAWPMYLVQGTTANASGNPIFVQLTAGAAVIGAVTQSGTWNIGSITTLPALVAGAAIIGKVGIDQTTDVTTNGVEIAPTAGAAAGLTPVVSASAENNHVLKASPGNLYSVYATNLTSTAGFLVVLNATTSPADGAITPLECVSLPASGNASISYNPGPAGVFGTGITAVLTSATTCFTKTTGVITGFIHGAVK